METVGMVEAELRARLIGEWSGGERRRARRSNGDGNGDGGCYGGYAEAKEEARKLKCERGRNGWTLGVIKTCSGPAWPRWAEHW